MPGPLTGLRVVEFAGIGPGPHAAMLLADHGADVVRINRPHTDDTTDLTLRGRTMTEADLKNPADLKKVRNLLSEADVLLEGFRPGVMERLGLGPTDVLADNPRLIYGRMTGWGQDGPLAHRAGHDLNYIARTGLASLIGTPDEPVPPLNLVGDFGGGSMFLVMGILAALYERARTGRGQVVDAAIVDGTAVLGAFVWDMRAREHFSDTRHTNFLDGSHPSYSYYRTSDGHYLAIAALEPQFFDILRTTLDLPESTVTDRHKPQHHREIRQLIAHAIAKHPRQYWEEVFADTDACVAPVNTMADAPTDPHLAARGTYTDATGTPQPRPAPRLSNHGRLDPPPLPHSVESLETVSSRWHTSHTPEQQNSD